MGRYYSGDLEGKFWFSMMSSDAPLTFGGDSVYECECPDCDGDGMYEDDDGRMVECEECDGIGTIYDINSATDLRMEFKQNEYDSDLLVEYLETFKEIVKENRDLFMSEMFIVDYGGEPYDLIIDKFDSMIKNIEEKIHVDDEKLSEIQDFMFCFAGALKDLADALWSEDPDGEQELLINNIKWDTIDEFFNITPSSSDYNRPRIKLDKLIERIGEAYMGYAVNNYLIKNEICVIYAEL